MVVADKDCIGIAAPLARSGANLFLHLFRQFVVVERQAEVEQYFGLPGTQFDAAAADFARAAMNG